MSSNVTYTLPAYDAATTRWIRVRAACEGEDAVKLLPGVLPYLNEFDQTPTNIARNRSYLERAVYFNATGRTLEGLIGMAFAKVPDNNLGKFKYLEDDSSGNGVSIYHVAQEVLSGVLQTGRHGILTDIVNERPCLVGYSAESIINWRVNRIGKANKLVLLVLKEEITEEEGDYSSKDITQFREFRLNGDTVEFKVWRGAKDSDPLLHEEGTLKIPHSTKGIGEIPFAFCGSINNSASIQPAPLRGLAAMNLAHFRDSADYQDSVFFSGQPQAWISGLSVTWREHLETNGTYVGSRTPLLLPEGGQFGFAQVQPNTLAREAMKSKEEAMIALGARVVEQSPVTKTATQAAGDIATNTSVLGLATGNASEAITISLRRLGLYDDAKPFKEAKFQITTDFSEQTLDPSKLKELVVAWQAGAYSRIDLRNNLKRMGVISPERTNEMIDEEVAVEDAQRIEKEGPAV